MQDASPSPRLVSDRHGPATVVHLTVPNLVHAADMADVAAALDGLLAEGHGVRLVLDCRAVTAMGGFLLAKLMALHRTLRAAGGALLLCGIEPELADLFLSHRLHTLLRVCASEEEAIACAG